MRRLIIADPGLSGPAGHHLSYSAAVAGAAAGRGLAAVVLAARGFSGGIDGAQCRAVLGAAYQSAGGGGAARRFAFGLAARLPGPLAGMVAPPLRALRRALRPVALDPLGAELARELAALGAGEGDALLLHSVSGANLHGLTAAALPAVTLLVVLRRMPAEMAADDPAPEPLPALLRRLSRHFGPRLRLFADTQALATQFSALCGVEVRAVPLPLRVPPVLQRPSARPPHVVFAGGARAEKGFAELPAALAMAAGKARFTIHSGPVGRDSDPLVQRAQRALRAMPRGGEGVALVETALDAGAYDALMASADLLLLPYDPVIYGARSSGILAESLALGIPAVVPAGCWMEDAAGADRAVFITPRKPPGPALLEALDALPSLTAACRAGAPDWRARHNPETLLTALLHPPAG